MKKKLFIIHITILVIALGLLPSCSSTLDDQPWADFASKVALEINISEHKVFEAFEQAFKEGGDVPSDRLSSRIQTITDEDVEQIAEWYRKRPEGVSLKWFNSIDYFGSEIQFLYSASDGILDGLASKVASILEISKQDAIDAFNRINRELIDNMHKDGLTRLVEEGCLTEDQVDVYFQWYLSRPDVISPGRIGSLQ